jgi:hypothetical protein
LKYTDFYNQYYFQILPSHWILGPHQTFLEFVQTQQGLRQKVLVQQGDQSKIVTRIHTIPPRIGELFYMRALLQHLPAFNFQDLQTVFSQVYPTFQQAAIALGLFEDVTEAARAMEEAIAAYCRPSQLRFLFSHLVLDLPTPAVNLWDRTPFVGQGGSVLIKFRYTARMS